ncbi:thioredoxin family protein [Alienimonas californiensis]|uniref:Thiol:disulfide interchange protein n=1 Tax=Alienimonas californiensis TaxID=2527989 RepID=A0A517PFS1_9PLAN|nr:thioredoxin family protein [Alienimonas californiensis]QDT18205.1 thiol:disulfide interchange protein precursor [Alienimonas californiensis]
MTLAPRSPEHWSPAVTPFAPAALLLTAFVPPTAVQTAVVPPAPTPVGRVAISSPAPAATALPVVKATPATTSASATPAVSAVRVVRTPAAEPVWRTDLTAAFAEAGQTGKPVLVLFGAEWCHYCHKQDDETLADAGVKKALAEGFIPVRLDVDEHRRVSEILQVDTLPQAVMLSPKADLLGRTKGYHTASQFKTALTQANAKHAAAMASRVAAAPAESATY